MWLLQRQSLLLLQLQLIGRCSKRCLCLWHLELEVNNVAGVDEALLGLSTPTVEPIGDETGDCTPLTLATLLLCLLSLVFSGCFRGCWLLVEHFLIADHVVYDLVHCLRHSKTICAKFFKGFSDLPEFLD